MLGAEQTHVYEDTGGYYQTREAIEHAPTNRRTCAGCGKKIAKGELHIRASNRMSGLSLNICQACVGEANDKVEGPIDLTKEDLDTLLIRARLGKRLTSPK